MGLLLLSIAVQIACAVHCIRNGRSGLWLMVIIFLSLAGCLAYAIFEILPQYSGRREVRAVKAAAVRRLDPERELRSARDALELDETPWTFHRPISKRKPARSRLCAPGRSAR